MRRNITVYDFINEFEEMGREDNFSYEGKKALFEYLEEYEEDTGAEIELDIIALCCEYTEYEDIEEFNKEYGKECEDIDDISYYTQVISINNDSFIILDF